ncbi:MAG: FtsW/RodA/SpoVE family cell cycle protein, partial [Alphaproteobacteria bacterium]
MTSVPRTDTSVLGRWWWTVDHLTLAALAVLMAFGVILAMAASPPVAVRIGLDEMYFVRRHLTLLPLALIAIVAVSLLTPAQIRLLALAVFCGSLVFLVLTLLVGSEVKGARRWLNIAGFSLQVSEFVKPSFAVVAAWLFARESRKGVISPTIICVGLYVTVVALLMAEPDVGQTVVVTAVWLAQFFLAGVSLWLVGALAALGVLGLAGAYFALPHVARRIDGFLDPSQGDSYQIDRSLDAFRSGGLFGRGPGEGQVKNSLPDAHADFI